MNEEEVRALIEEAVDLARNRSTPDNLCDEAVVQRVLEERFIDGRWRSRLFETDTKWRSFSDQ